MSKVFDYEWAGTRIKFAVDKVARQANGSVWLECDDTVVLATAVMSENVRQGMDFFPLTCDLEERMYAVGKFPGGFIKREGRPSERAILGSRLIDRSVRPLFPKGMRNDVQLICMPLSAVPTLPPEVLALNAASAALHVSDIPWHGPVGAVRVGRSDGQFIVNPNSEVLAESDFDFVVCGTSERVIMLEGGFKQAPEDDVLAAIEFAMTHIRSMIAFQQAMRAEVGKPKLEPKLFQVDPAIVEAVRVSSGQEISESIRAVDKQQRESAMSELKNEIVERMSEDYPDHEVDLAEAIEAVVKESVRNLILDEKRRPDGRTPLEIRPISCDVGILPRTHGSGLFTRGQTQVLTVTTLGGPGDAQDVDTITDQTEKRYVHHYNFPPFSVGEARPLRGAGRREIGHGALAEKALLPLIPPKEEFPYSLRLVSEALESNGSTSMASVCGSTLSLMDAGVPILAPASGIAMGLITRGDEYVILSDIQGTEDFSGDMDFKVAGSEQGVTAIQMDTKIHGLTMQMVRDTLFQAKEGRAFILRKMMERISEVRGTMSAHAPRMFIVQIDPEKIGEIIGPGGKTIKKIQAETGAQIDIEQDGKVYITCANAEGGERARAMIEGMGTLPQVGAKFKGKVTRLMNFGAFVEFLPGKEGLIRVEDSGIDGVRNIATVLAVGDEVLVSVSEIDSQGRINLSRRGLMDQQPEFTRADGTKPPTVAPVGSDVPPPRDFSGGSRRDGGRGVGGRGGFSRPGGGRFGGGGSTAGAGTGYQEEEPVRATFRPKRR